VPHENTEVPWTIMLIGACLGQNTNLGGCHWIGQRRRPDESVAPSNGVSVTELGPYGRGRPFFLSSPLNQNLSLKEKAAAEV
jgi:hypothetical protein